VIRLLLGWLTKGPLDRVLDTLDRRVTEETERERLRADVIREHLRARPAFLQSGGLWLMLLFAGPLAFWWGAVLVYSVLWCQGCVWPQPWIVAALPAPLDEWAGLIVVSIFGVVGVTSLRR
jgi:hypothetical protein